MPFDVISTVPLSGYAPSTALGVDTTTPQLYISGTDQMWEPVGGVALPVSVADGGTGATTAGGARTNLGAAASGANNDITSLAAIPTTAINSAGYQFGIGAFGAVNTVQIANQTWTGTGVTGFGIGVSSATEYSLISASGISTSEGVTANIITSLGPAVIWDGIQVDGGITTRTPTTPLQLMGAGVTGNTTVRINSGGAGTSGVALLGFGNNYPTQSTVGSAGSASAPPTNPSLWLQATINDTVYVSPWYKAS